jgi:hypothetical protein
LVLVVGSFLGWTSERLTDKANKTIDQTNRYLKKWRQRVWQQDILAVQDWCKEVFQGFVGIPENRLFDVVSVSSVPLLFKNV